MKRLRMASHLAFSLYQPNLVCFTRPSSLIGLPYLTLCCLPEYHFKISR